MNEPGHKLCEIKKSPETFPNSKFSFILVKNHGKLAKNRFFDAQNRHLRAFLTSKN